MKHHPPSQPLRLSCRWLLLALLAQATLGACGSSTVPAGSSGATGTAAALHCAPATAKPDASGAQTVALCAPLPQGHS